MLLFAGKKTLWKHNVYGLTPTVGSAHALLVLYNYDSFEMFYFSGFKI